MHDDLHPKVLRVWNTHHISIQNCGMTHPVSIVANPVSTVVLLHSNDVSVYKLLDISCLFCNELSICAETPFTLENKVIQATTIETLQVRDQRNNNIDGKISKLLGCSLPITETLKLQFGSEPSVPGAAQEHRVMAAIEINAPMLQEIQSLLCPGSYRKLSTVLG